IEQVKILEFRESRGWEVRYPFFTKQFIGVGLAHKKRYRLDSHIDGITGATLSVRAVKKVATLALFFHRQVNPLHAKGPQFAEQ
ncbi:MAG: FMN-binding protein, partial [Porticoccaceae bacterium]|nr:FMN-binding protein [Porticoccaceae bacterium]